MIAQLSSALRTISQILQMSRVCLLAKNSFLEVKTTCGNMDLILLVSLHWHMAWNSSCTSPEPHGQSRLSRGSLAQRPVSTFRLWELTRNLVNASRKRSGVYVLIGDGFVYTLWDTHTYIHTHIHTYIHIWYCHQIKMLSESIIKWNGVS